MNDSSVCMLRDRAVNVASSRMVETEIPDLSDSETDHWLRSFPVIDGDRDSLLRSGIAAIDNGNVQLSRRVQKQLKWLVGGRLTDLLISAPLVLRKHSFEGEDACLRSHRTCVFAVCMGVCVCVRCEAVKTNMFDRIHWGFAAANLQYTSDSAELRTDPITAAVWLGLIQIVDSDDQCVESDALCHTPIEKTDCDVIISHLMKYRLLSERRHSDWLGPYSTVILRYIESFVGSPIRRSHSWCAAEELSDDECNNHFAEEQQKRTHALRHLNKSIESRDVRVPRYQPND